MTLDKKDLKIQALKERVNTLIDEVDNFRVEITMLTYDNQEKDARIKELEGMVASADASVEKENSEEVHTITDLPD